MGSAGIDPSSLIVKPVTADGLHEKRRRLCGEVCTVTEYLHWGARVRGVGRTDALA